MQQNCLARIVHLHHRMTIGCLSRLRPEMKSQKLTITEGQLCGRWGLKRAQKREAKDSLAHGVHLHHRIATRLFSFENWEWKGRTTELQDCIRVEDKDWQGPKKRKRDATDRLACNVHLHHTNTARCLPYLKLVRDEKSEAHNHNITTCNCSHNQMFHVNPNPNLPLNFPYRTRTPRSGPPPINTTIIQMSLNQLLHLPQFNPSRLTAAQSTLTPNFNPLTSLLAPPLGQIKSQKPHKPTNTNTKQQSSQTPSCTHSQPSIGALHLSPYQHNHVKKTLP